MDLSTSRSVARLAVPVLLALLASGCGGDSPSPTAAPAATNHGGADHDHGPTAERQGASLAQRGLGQRPRVGCVEHRRRQLRRWLLNRSHRLLGSQLRRLGAPSDRLQPAYTLVRKVIQSFDKGAKCYARAAGVISEVVWLGSDREARMFEEALDCGHAAEGNGANVLYKTVAAMLTEACDGGAMRSGLLRLFWVWRVRPVPRSLPGRSRPPAGRSCKGRAGARYRPFG